MSEDNKNIIDIASKSNSKEKIYFGTEDLKKLVRFEWNQDYFNNDNSDDNLYERLVVSGSYRPTYHDFVTACRNMLVKNKGFSDDDIRQLKDYIDNEQDTIFAMAKHVNPIKAMMGAKIK